MKKKKIILIVVLVVVVLIGTIALVNVLPMINMHPTETGMIPDTEIYAINDGINSVFFINSYDGYIVVDAGTNADKIQKLLDENKINPLDVKHVFLTHSDYDHVGALTLFEHADIYMSEDELQMVDGTIKRNTVQRNTLPGNILEEIILLKDNQKIMIGDYEIECIKVPGHTPGSMAYVLNGETMFTGDAFMVKNNVMKPHPFTMYNETAAKSIQRLNDIKNKCDFIVTAHYGYYKAGALESN